MPLRPNFDAVREIIVMGERLQGEANPYGINRVFDDGGYRELVLYKLFDLRRPPNVAVRTGDDAQDDNGNQYELKTVNFVNLSGKVVRNPWVTTCHHFNYHILDRYRHVTAILVGFFFVNTPARVYALAPRHLEPFFRKCEARLENEEHINNPKFHSKIAVQHGELIFRDSHYDSYFSALEIGTDGMDVTQLELDFEDD